MPESVSLYVTPKDEAETEVIFHDLSGLAQALRASCSSVVVSSHNWTEDEDLATDPEGELYHDEKTLVKVRRAIESCFPKDVDFSPDVVINAKSASDVIINAILNEGILFREKRV